MPSHKEIVTEPLKRFRKVFDAVERPKGGLPTMPTKVTTLASDELGDIMAKYVAWREFTEDCHAEACATYAQVKSQYDLESDKALLRSEASTVTERKAEAKNDPKVARLYKDLSDAEIYCDLLGKKLESFTNVLSMLSRELTRRGISQ